MKAKRLLQILVSLVMLFTLVGSAQPVSASTGPAPDLDAVVIDRNLNYWDANYFGFISSGIYEKWNFEFTTSHNFVVTVTKVTGDVVPMVILLDGLGTELARGTGSLTSTQPAGNYFFQVQPESGMGLYMLTLREVVVSQPSVSTVVVPTSINVGETAAVTVSLGEVPAEGYSSAEFTCTYNATLIEVGNVVLTDLFGIDPVMAATTPQDGSFIVAVAGSNGKKATTSGTAFTFSVEGLQPGQTAIECAARISKGDGALTGLPSTPASLEVLGSLPTPTFTAPATETPTPVESPTSTPVESPTATPVESPTPTPVESPTATPVESPTPTPVESPTSTPVESPTATPVESATPTPVESPTATPVESATPTPVESPTNTPEPSATPAESPTPTATPLPDGTLTGKVLAGKQVTVGLYNAEDTLVTSVTANTDGTFSLSAPAGTYTVRATADGFLSAEGAVTLTAGETGTKPEVTLLAGDIVNNNVIDQFDAMTIGMSYNTTIPAAADLNNDGIINVLDLELLARNYRATGPISW